MAKKYNRTNKQKAAAVVNSIFQHIKRNKKTYRAIGRTARKTYRKYKTRTRNRKRKHNYKVIRANTAGTSKTSCRIYVRKTPKKQRFLRKLFANNPTRKLWCNSFGFSWISTKVNRCIWYSVCHLKYNNLLNYMKNRVQDPSQTNSGTPSWSNAVNAIGNTSYAAIYIGKCMFMYELYNPTNYLMTVYIYDLICKKDTPNPIKYSTDSNTRNASPEACMHQGALSFSIGTGDGTIQVADDTVENNTFYNSPGLKPTDYHYFNTFWKVKGVKKIILPPNCSHHHTVIYEPKRVLTQGSLVYPHRFDHQNPAEAVGDTKIGIAGITQATLFGFEGQVATDAVLPGNEPSNSDTVGTLPGKLIVKCIKKVNIWNTPLRAKILMNSTSLSDLRNPEIFTDLVRADPETVQIIEE